MRTNGRALHELAKLDLARRVARAKQVFAWVVIVALLLAVTSQAIEAITDYFKREVNVSLRVGVLAEREMPLAVLCLLMDKEKNQSWAELRSQITTPSKFLNYSLPFDEQFQAVTFHSIQEKQMFYYPGEMRLIVNATRRSLFARYACYWFDANAYNEGTRVTRDITTQMQSFAGFRIESRLAARSSVVYLMFKEPGDYSLAVGDFTASNKLSHGASYSFAFKQWQTRLLEAPFATNCFDYSREPVITSRGMCVDKCLAAQQLKRHRTISQITTFFGHGDMNYSAREEPRNRCESRCRLGCDLNTFLPIRSVWRLARGDQSIGANLGPPELVSSVTTYPMTTLRDLFFKVFGFYAFCLGCSVLSLVETPSVQDFLHFVFEALIGWAMSLGSHDSE